MASFLMLVFELMVIEVLVSCTIYLVSAAFCNRYIKFSFGKDKSSICYRYRISSLYIFTLTKI
ncbi:hypothetical protein A9264_09130 [Vibrio sp. UCD-FRSSP16_10]|nr:hypothetical protein A9260_06230 [Vibrio sp. UCD-FRSSP16_30]OBT22102.1 hypothetical protein A9264_09130 [Vibrio sp. UCD-FRSSP16_10]